MSDNAAWKAAKPFVNGGLSGMAATCIIQPIDMVKVRIQLGAKGSPLGVAKDIIAKDGFGSLYKGLNAGLLRQATYTTTRLGVFQVITDKTRIVRDDGVAGLFRGGGPTVVRAMALNMGMLASNDQAKEMIVAAGVFEKGSKLPIIGAAAIAGFFASACSLPFDFIKTRMQKMTPNPDGTMPYKSAVDCAMQTLRTEGPLKFYTGFPTFCLR
ncbi:mitochondrial substrate carrier protein [Raphidocelis subcapitata]|uniref:Mitochondrial substrate carrier protein n=1 Tax=Raphidocelis subcapitata TaxID=307507 RepID=A0A2V0PFM8_9CHLO|nr:mitochondrial substrate carrier protein [Raphidocelis subcapitata]|eukprot:GBF98596.1 mitochondrial substrate carrier protein [Raphidocelis subcapitata]